MANENEPGPAPSSATEAQPAQLDPSTLMRSKEYRRLLVFAAVIGLVVSAVSWAFLESVHVIQHWVYKELPEALGFHEAPSWWPLPVLVVAGLLIAVAVVKLPGHGGHEPSNGLNPGGLTTPAELPGILLAALATLGLGLVLGPEAPLMALAGGVAVFLVQLSRRQVSNPGIAVLGAAGSFAALATVFGSPVIGAVIVLEAAGLAGASMTMVLLPGLIAAGVGSLVFTGIGSTSGLSAESYAMPPLHLTPYETPTFGDFLWSIPLGLAAALVVFVVFRLGKTTMRVVHIKPLVLFPAAALLVGVLAILFEEVSGKSSDVILFSGEHSMAEVFEQADTVSMGVLCLLFACKAVAWGISMGAARGGPTFPAIFLGLVGGVMAADVFNVTESAAIAVLVGAGVVSVLRLPLAAIVLALLMTQGGPGLAPLIIVGVVVAHIATLALTSRAPGGGPETAATEPSAQASTAEAGRHDESPH
jgi:H+/Cl- antiporter ClcA